jgi:H+/Cl- antiporter ClcA
MHPWWTDQQAGWIGGIAGAAFGLFGGLFGTVAGLCAPRGKCKRVVYGMAAVLIAVGAGGLCAGIVALALTQPYGVWYPLILMGGIASVLSCVFTPLVRMRYREAENRRLEAEQLRRG